ncbi:pseudouridine synthase [Melampsora americana]|nr:pseudouridine synthase [Melampsora americana]
MSELPPSETSQLTGNSTSTGTVTHSLPGRFKSDIDIILARSVQPRNESLLPNPSESSELQNTKTATNQSEPTHKSKNQKSSSHKHSHPRDHKRKSDWQDGDRHHNKSNKTNETTLASGSKEKRLPKRKVAVLLGYYGKGYQGSQVNPGMKTIEGEVFKAFVKAGCVSEDNSAHPNKVGLQRAARTDANVHAGCNLICLKLILDPPSLKENVNLTTLDSSEAKTSDDPQHHSLPLIKHINSFLPEEIRLWGLERVQNSFHARTLCDSRTYEYSLPTYLFLPPKPGTALYKRLDSIEMNQEGKKWSESYDEDESEALWWKKNDSELELDSEPNSTTLSNFKSSVIHKKSSYRISTSMLQRLKQSVQKFKGTHNFHNFTVGKEFKDRSAIRIIREMTVSDPFVVGGQSEADPATEWISVKFYGQSFMLHQIRKMIGLIILLCRTRTPSTLIPELYGPVRVRIPKAPGLGLILHHPHFDGYNKRVLEANRNLSAQKQKSFTNKSDVETQEENELRRETIDPEKWIEGIERFKKDILYKKMWEEEQKEDGFGVWINYVDVCNVGDLDFLNPKGVIPSTLVDSDRNKKGALAMRLDQPQTDAQKVMSDDEDIHYQDGEEIEEG